MAASALVFGVADLRHHPGERRPYDADVVLDGLETSSARVPAGQAVHLDLLLEAQGDEIMVVGTVEAPWEGECRRCLEPATGVATATVQEVFEPRPSEGETYPVEGDRIDLEPLVREAVLPSLPLAPLCREDCQGPVPDAWVGDEGDDEGDERPRDPRWAALDVLNDDG